jgi:arylsulfatase A-like enzyme
LHPLPEMLQKFPAAWDDKPYRGECGYYPHPRPRAAYAAMIATLDDAVGKIMAELDAAGLKDKTLVVFTSDNGATHAHAASDQFHIGGADPKFFNSTAGLHGYKGSVYEGGIRVPMIARFPGKIPAGTTNETPCYFADWFPTLCAASQLTPPPGMDGENLWPVLTEGKKLTERKPLVWVYPEYTGQVAVRMGNYKALRQKLATPKKISPWELYDISKDPGETKNLAAENPDIIKQAEETLRRETAPNPNFPLKLEGVF